MNNDKETFFSILRLIRKNPYLSQRKMAANLNLSLGKLNYCMKALKDKGFLKIKNFKNNKNKLIKITIVLSFMVIEKIAKIKKRDKSLSKFEFFSNNLIKK